MSETDDETQLARLAWTVAAALLLVLAWPVLRGEVYARDDLANFHLPLRHFYARCLASGQSWAWCPDIFCGVYLHGEGQIGMLHPLHLLLYRTLPLWLAFDVEVLASYVFLFLGTRTFLVRVTGRRDAAVLGALVSSLSAFPMLHFTHTSVVTVWAHAPWLLAAIHTALTAADPRRVALARLALTLLTASQALLGEPQPLWFSTLTESLYALFLAFTRRSGHGLAGLAIAKGLGWLVAAAQLLPTLDYLSRSVRSTVPAWLPYRYSLDVGELAQLVAPYVFRNRALGGGEATNEYGIYGGAVSVVLWVWLAIRGRRLDERRAIALFAGLLALLSVLLALGKLGLVYRLVVALPVVGKFRAPCRYVAIFGLATGLAAALAFVDLSKARSSRQDLRALALVPCASVAVTMIAVAVRVFASGSPLAPRIETSWLALAAGPVLVGLATLLVFRAARGSRGALAGLVLLVGADQGAYGLSFILGSADSVAGVASRTPVPLAYDGRLRVRHATNRPLLRGARLADGYLGLAPARRLSQTSSVTDHLAGVVAIGAPEPNDPFFERSMTWRRAPEPLPRVRLLARAEVGDVERIDLETTALVDSTLSLDDGPPGAARIVSESPGQLVVAVTAPARRLLAVSESWDPGWRARIGERDLQVLRVNGDFLGVVVEPGEHEVRLSFEPPSLTGGIELSAIGLGLAIFVFVGSARRASRPTGGAIGRPGA